MYKLLFKVGLMAVLLGKSYPEEVLEKSVPQQNQQTPVENQQKPVDPNSQIPETSPTLGTSQDLSEFTSPSEFSTEDAPPSPQGEIPTQIMSPPPPPEINPVPEEAQQVDDKIENLPKPYSIPLTFRYRETIFGQRCYVPFTYQNKEYIDCYESPNGKEYCVMPNGALYICAELPPVKPLPMQFEDQYTISGQKCRLPVLHRGTVLVGCLNLTSGDNVCYDGKKWEECGLPPSSPPPPTPLTPPVTRQLTVLGVPCEFPFEYENKLQFECLKLDGKEWCQVGNEWQQCAVEGEEEDEIVGLKSSIEQKSGRSNYQLGQIYEEYDYEYSETEKTQGEKEGEGGMSSTVIILVVVFVFLLLLGGILGIIALRSRGQKQQLKKKPPQMSSELQAMPRDKLIEQLAGLGHA